MSNNTATSTTVNAPTALSQSCLPRVTVMGDPWIVNNSNTQDYYFIKNFVFNGGILFANVNRAGTGALAFFEVHTYN